MSNNRRTEALGRLPAGGGAPQPESPLRALGAPAAAEGFRVLSDPGVRYRDGSEDVVRRIVEEASDLGSLSDELASAAGAGGGWAELYHLSADRANVLRPLRLEGLGVLEIGAGCGPVTRYLGERCAWVDALEPVAARAAVARSRTRDQASVEVFAGALADVPPVPAYDLVTLVGVLEYVGEGDPDPSVYSGFLAEARRRLKPGGTVVIAIENRLGVKYLTGSPEDHTGRPYDGLEGYPNGAPVRTFGRAELAGVVEAAGLRASFLHAMPDYKLTRAVFADELLAGGPRSHGLRHLAWEVPSFPSPVRGVHPSRVRGADERSVWRGLVEDGVGGHFSNSFLVLAGTAGAGRRLWPAGTLGVFYSTGRRAKFSTETRVVTAGGPVRFERRRLAGASVGVSERGLTLAAESSDLRHGTPLLDVLAASDCEDIPRWMRRWRRIVDGPSADDAGTAPATAVDLVPHNILVAEGRLLVIDQEWYSATIGPDDVLSRGILMTAYELALRVPPGRWVDAAGVTTVGGLAQWLGAAAGLERGGLWLERAVESEARLQAQVHTCEPGSAGWDAAVAREADGIRAMVGRDLRTLPLGVREHEASLQMEARAREAEASAERHGREATRAAFQRDRAEAVLDRTRRALEAAEGQLAAVRDELRLSEHALDENRRALGEAHARGATLLEACGEMERAMADLGATPAARAAQQLHRLTLLVTARLWHGRP